MIRPSGIVRAKASSEGVALPRAGSFQDAVLQEMLFREQNLKYSEVTLSTRMMEQMLLMLVELTTQPEHIARRKNEIHRDINLWLKTYEAELYQDRYLPEYQRAEREQRRAAAQQEEERKIRDAISAQKVASFHLVR